MENFIAIAMGITLGLTIGSYITAKIESKYKRVCDICWRDIKRIHELEKERIKKEFKD